MKLKHFLLCAILFLGSCKAQKSSIEYKEVIKVDTLIMEQVKTIYKATTDTLRIGNPCDSFPFYIYKTIPYGSVKLKSSKKGLELIVNSNSHSDSSRVEKSKSYHHADVKKMVEVIKYRIPEWAIYALIIETLLIVGFIYSKIPKV